MFVAGAVASSVLLTSSAFAEGVVVLPVTKPGYEPEAVASLMFGTVQPSDSDADSQSIIGAELSFRCIFLQIGDNQLRQQLSFTSWEDGGLTARNIELNAHYQIPVAEDTKIGVGPGVGLILTDLSGSDNPTFLSAQLGASVHYTGLGPVFLGAEWRYQITTKESFYKGFGDDDMNNWRLAAKVGYMF